MTYLEQLHKAHKERQARFAAFKEPELLKPKFKTIYINPYKPLLQEPPRYASIQMYKDPKGIRFNKLLKLVMKRFSCSEAELLGTKRLYHLVQARFLISYIGSKIIGLTYSSVGKRMNRDHTAVINAVCVCRKNIGYLPDWTNVYECLIKELMNV